MAINYHQLRVRFAQYNTKLINDQKDQKIIDDQKKLWTEYGEMNPQLDKNPESDRHRSVSDVESSQPQFPLCDGPWEEEFSDSANLDSNLFRSATCRTQRRSENISSHQALPATLSGR